MSKIVSIHSFRGGTGKSNITANLAAQLAMRDKKVGIVDTDIASPGIHVLFGLDENSMGHTLNEFLHGECQIGDVAYYVGGVDDEAEGRRQLKGMPVWLFPSSIKSSEISRVVRDGYDVNILNRGLQTLRKQLDLDYLLIDTHPGIGDETLLSLAISDLLVLLMRPDNQDFQGTAVTIDVARSLDVPQLRLVVNKALSKYDLNQVKQTVEQTYGAEVAGVLPLTEDMADNASADIFSLRFPKHPWSVALRGVVDNILAIP